MSVQNVASRPLFDVVGMRSLEFADPSWSIGLQDRPLLRAHKQLPRKRIHTSNTLNLRSQFKEPATQVSSESLRSVSSPTSSRPRSVSTASELPPTPPILHQEPSDYALDDSSVPETTILRSGKMTPSHQRSPPTPDITPPLVESAWWTRPFLGSQPSISSTHAESFKTAREELSSDDDKEDSLHPPQYSSHQKFLGASHAIRMDHFTPRRSPLAQPQELTPPHESDGNLSQNESEATDTTIESEKEHQIPDKELSTPPTSGVAEMEVRDTELSIEAPEVDAENDKGDHGERIDSVKMTIDELSPPSSPDGAEKHSLHISKSLRRDQSLRERLEESKLVVSSPSTEQFAHAIGLSFATGSPDLKNKVNSWRFSGISATSTVEAIVVDNTPRCEPVLRHRGKNASLRSTSSPLPNSKRDSLHSNPESLHRLVHKKGRLSNQNRWSVGSDASRSLSGSSSIAPPPKPEPEIIHVAVIPKRTSSLRSSTDSNNRRSLSLSMSSGSRKIIDFLDAEEGNLQKPNQKRRTKSDSLPSGASFATRGREKGGTHLAPPGSSSLSASTTRSNSRTNSVTSENVRMRRMTAEADLHQTLARMESERSVRTVRIGKAHVRYREGPSTRPIDPEPDLWLNVLPPSTHNTPFSQPSVQSASPDPVEMGEARAVNIFPHNNRSLQLIERHSMPEPRAVQVLQSSNNDLELVIAEPRRSADVRQDLVVDSPLRNPRRPPQPPKFSIIPPTPADLTPIGEENRQLGSHGESKRAFGRFGSLRRPSVKARPYSESFVKSFSRSLSLNNARNKKADQDLDRNLHPFWRPRGFWDDFSETNSAEDLPKDDIIVKNSLGMPQKRVILSGPLSLVRRISDSPRRWKQGHGLVKQSSYGSLSKIRGAKKIRKVPGLGLGFQFIGLRDIQRRVSQAKQKKEDEKREKRRENLRKSIGPNIIPNGDSLFPAAISATAHTVADTSLAGTTVVGTAPAESPNSSGTENGVVGDATWLFASV